MLLCLVCLCIAVLCNILSVELLNPQHTFIVHMKMAGGGIRASFEIDSMVRGYHCYNTIWNAVIGEELPCKLELSNPEDRFAVAVCQREITVGHVPRRISSICSSFLRRKGTIDYLPSYRCKTIFC